MKIAYINKLSLTETKPTKVFLITSNSQENIKIKLEEVNRFLTSPVKIIDKLPEIDNKVHITSGDTIIEFTGKYKMNKYKSLKGKISKELLEGYKINSLGLDLLSAANYLDKADNTFLLFSYTYYWRNLKNDNKTNYEIGYISKIPKDKLIKNIDEYNHKILIKKPHPFSNIISGSEYTHTGIEILEGDSCFRKNKTIEFTSYNNESYIKTTQLADYNYLTNEFEYNEKQVEKFIKENIEK